MKAAASWLSVEFRPWKDAARFKSLPARFVSRFFCSRSFIRCAPAEIRRRCAVVDVSLLDRLPSD